jgi:hypothetical protein
MITFLSLSGCYVTPASRDQIPATEKEVVFIDDHDKEKSDAFVRVHEWIAKNFNSANDVIQMQDKEAGTVIVKAIYPYMQDFGAMTLPVNVQYTLSVYVKDKKIKTEFITGLVSDRAYSKYIPEANMSALLYYYKKIHSELLNSLNSTNKDF